MRGACFDGAAEKIFEITGARVKSQPSGDVVCIDMSCEDEVLRYRNLKAFSCDFEFRFPGDDFIVGSRKKKLAIASVLEICGFLQKKEIKTVCFL